MHALPIGSSVRVFFPRDPLKFPSKKFAAIATDPNAELGIICSAACLFRGGLMERLLKTGAEDARCAPTLTSSHSRAKQCAKIAEIRQSLLDAGVYALDEQADVLNLPRSTAWSVLKGNHKASGLSAKVLKRMLDSPQLPSGTRKVIHEYIDQKLAGAFGHSKSKIRIFGILLKEGFPRATPTSLNL